MLSKTKYKYKKYKNYVTVVNESIYNAFQEVVWREASQFIP